MDMPWWTMALLGGVGVLLVLQCVLLMRRPVFTTPPDLQARLGLLEQGLQALTQASARSEAGGARVEQQLHAFTRQSSESLESSRRTLDEQLGRTVAEARHGRAELTTAFEAFEVRLSQRLGAFDAGTARRQAELQQGTMERLEAVRQVLDTKLAQTLEASRLGRSELMASFQAFEGKLEQRLGGFEAAMGARDEALQRMLSARLDEADRAQRAQFAQAQAEAAAARKELADALIGFRQDLATTLQQLAVETRAASEALATRSGGFEQQIQTRFETLGQRTQGTLDGLKADVVLRLGEVSTTLKDQLEGHGRQMQHQFGGLRDAVAQQLQAMAQGSQQHAEQLRQTLNDRLAAIQADNTDKLEAMRRTVDEKLHATLEQRLGDSFKLVSERLEQVHAGLGEMKSLAGSVGDLKRVMTNVRTRGTWGEVQLGAIIESLLTAEQFGRNVKTVPGSNDLVEYAIRMPGKVPDETVWLPIDAKYPVEHHQRLQDAQDALDKGQIAQAAAAFEASLRQEARKIATKYLSPPHTTDFAILFLPTEGLFADVCRVPGMVEALQNDFRIVVAGPTTLAAMLNSLRLGFRTLAIEKRSSEVWGLLAKVKTEFRKFGETLDATQRSIDAAANKFKDIGVRTRAIERKLRDVEVLPVGEGSEPLLTGLDEEEPGGA